MRPLVHEISTAHTPESLVEQLQGERGLVLLRSGLFDSPQARYSFVTARPFLTFRSFGSRCELGAPGQTQVQFGNPWRVLDSWMARYELLEDLDLPFPLGGCFGYWGYDLKNFVEPKLPRRATDELELPDCHVGFYDCVVVFDHQLGKTWLISTGLNVDGSRNEERANAEADFWETHLRHRSGDGSAPTPVLPRESAGDAGRLSFGAPSCQINAAFRKQPERLIHAAANSSFLSPGSGHRAALAANFTRAQFIQRVQRALAYIRAGDIYQVNLSQRLEARCLCSGWNLFERLTAVSPAPFSAYLDCGEFQLASSSPELFLRLSGAHVQTRPIKGTRPRSSDLTRDAQLTCELQTSAKEMAELVMITDLLRNDLGKVCEFGSVQVPELVRLERYPQVQHLVSTVEGRLRSAETHFSAFASCFPGGSITGAPKFRAMEIIDELEPVTRGPYTGALGYLGFNRESQLSIVIRTAIHRGQTAWFHVGAGIVVDSVPTAEYEETLAKARGFIEALRLGAPAVGEGVQYEDIGR
jgi:para-aminobenzoate synthetase component 1